MPGLVGLITKRPRQWAEPQLCRMLDVIRHETFYTTGTWIDESSGVYVAWTAHADAFADNMPVQDKQSGKVLVFSGEEYRGHQSKVDGASYVIRLYEQDPSFPKGLNGRFHGLLTDKTTGTTLLFNDRYGMHRLYYHETKDAFYFAVEAKAILAVRPELRRLNPRAL